MKAEAFRKPLADDWAENIVKKVVPQSWGVRAALFTPTIQRDRGGHRPLEIDVHAGRDKFTKGGGPQADWNLTVGKGFIK
eukprot:16006106-Heterocapsa_arctica.AAC.1